MGSAGDSDEKEREMMERLIFHVDVNSAFLSWESKRRVENGQSDLRQIPSCIGGNPETRRGIVLAKSIPAKKYGIKTGEPLSMALRKCPALTIAPPDFKLYAACSKAFKDMCREYAPVVEEFSIDECFLDFTGTEYIYPDPIALAYEIKNRIRDELGFTVNVGIGRNKLCAKMASDFEKPDKVHTLFPEELAQKMWPLPVGELLYVGSASAGKLKAVSIHTIGDLAHADRKLLKRLLGDKFSEQAYFYANGLDDSEVRKEPEEAKDYSNSVTLEQDVTDLETGMAERIVVGIGINVRKEDFPAELINIASSLRVEDVTRNRIIAEVTHNLLELFDAFDAASFMPEYISHNIVVGKRVGYERTVKNAGINGSVKTGTEYEKAVGVVKEVCDDGSLLVADDDGIEDRIFTGEIKMGRNA